MKEAQFSFLFEFDMLDALRIVIELPPILPSSFAQDIVGQTWIKLLSEVLRQQLFQP